MAKKDIKLEKTETLEKKMFELEAEYIDKKLAINNNTLKDTSVLKKIQKDTARIKTILSERKNNE